MCLAESTFYWTTVRAECKLCPRPCTNHGADVKAVIPYLNLYCTVIKDPGNYHERMVKDWVRLGLDDPGFMSGIYLAACRHLALYEHQPVDYPLLAAEYKLACLRDLNSALAKKSPLLTDATVSKALMLAFDEVGRSRRQERRELDAE